MAHVSCRNRSDGGKQRTRAGGRQQSAAQQKQQEEEGHLPGHQRVRRGAITAQAQEESQKAGTGQQYQPAQKQEAERSLDMGPPSTPLASPPEASRFPEARSREQVRINYISRILRFPGH